MRKSFKVVIVVIVDLFLLALFGCTTGIPQEEYDVLFEERDTLRAALEQNENDLSEAKKANEELEKSNSDLIEQLDELSNSKNALQTEYNIYFEKSSEYNRLTEIEKQGEIELASKTQELKDIEAETDALEKDKAAIADEISNLTSQKNTLEEEIYNLENKIIEYKEQPVQLTNGSYTAGVDFQEGKYDLYAVAGKGTVFYTDSEDYTNHFNEMMAVNAGSYYISSYQNAKLTRGVVIQISGVTIELREKVN